MSVSKTPYADQDVHEIQTLVSDLENKSNKTKKGFRAKKTSFKVYDSPDGIVADSWRFQDWDYKRRDLPTYARGLFTTKNRRNQPEIAVRGYDKFFNVNEVRETQWDFIEERTQGPYELTLKENGCIIFVAGLEDETLLVCSKHSTGPRSDVEMSHSMAGERWVDRQLTAIGKTRRDLARELRKRNATAIAELCDDDFEEHILAYGPDKAGLYLHGININVPEFMTYPSDLVQSFADEWGFRKVGLQMFDDVSTVRQFLEGVAETGAHEGRDVEGFVIRCRMSTNPERSPYNDWFFKFKFEEPYLMYRQWRECTKALIAGNPPKFKKHVKITEEYLLYARQRLAKDPKLGKLYNQNHGIIALRNDFLNHKNIKGSDAANIELDFGGNTGALVTQDVVLVPIATIGCGKTTVAVGLTHLFGWAHVQNDNITGKNRPAQMVKAVLTKLVEGVPVVISDRNNSERREREQIIKDIKLANANARLVALNFAHGDIDEVRRVTRERVLRRGDNHQTIQAASDKNKVIGIMENFISRFQPVNPDSAPDDGFDHIIDLDPAADSRVNLETVINELHKTYPRLVPDVPSSADMDEATQAAIEDYTPDLRHAIPDRTSKKNPGSQSQAIKKKKPLEYVAAFVPTKELNAALEKVFQGADKDASRFYVQLKQTRRIQSAFHVTLIHRSAQNSYPEIWAEYSRLENETMDPDGKIGDVEVELERVVWNERIMAIVTRLHEPGVTTEPTSASPPEEAKWKCVNRVAHITVGTRDDRTKPVVSNDLLAKWLDEGLGNGIQELVFEPKIVLNGAVRGVLSR